MEESSNLPGHQQNPDSSPLITVGLWGRYHEQGNGGSPCDQERRNSRFVEPESFRENAGPSRHAQNSRGMPSQLAVNSGTAESNPPETAIPWRYTKYFVSELMNAEIATLLLSKDAEFLKVDGDENEIVKAVDITNEPLTKPRDLVPSDTGFEDFLQMSDLNDGETRIIFVPQLRAYSKHGTFNKYELSRKTLMRIVSACEIPPDVIEVLHDNNGAWGVHTSYCADVGCEPVASEERPEPSVCAYHLWLKPQHWWNEEHFVYARLDIHSRKKFFLVAGTPKRLISLEQQVRQQFIRPDYEPHLFSVLLALVKSWTNDLQEYVRKKDFKTQELESDTGWSSVGHTQAKPLPPEKLALRRDSIITKDALTHAVCAAQSLGELCFFLSEHVENKACRGITSPHRPSQLKKLFLQYESRHHHLKGQAQRLVDRIDVQWSIVNTLMAQHSNTLNAQMTRDSVQMAGDSVQMARDSRADSIAMRRISFVTLAFLPATFLATFFSMAFFHTKSGHIIVDTDIWIYVACVIPLTLVVAWKYIYEGMVSKLVGRTRNKRGREDARSQDESRVGRNGV